MERKLAAILAADVAGYSRLMELDEAGTFEQLKTRRIELVEPAITAHRGSIFKLMGDGLLAEFGSVVDAVECAVEIQRGMAERNAGLPEDHRIDVRIGVNLGEVIVEGTDRHGEGVNIAARLQQLADSGAICVSGKVANEVEKKLAFGFESLGAQRVKNITEPIPVYRVKLDGVRGPAKRKRARPALTNWARPVAAAMVLLAGLVAAGWYGWVPSPTAQVARAHVPIMSGNPNKGLEWIDFAVKRDPNGLKQQNYNKGWALRVLGKYDDALAAFKQSFYPEGDSPLNMAIVLIRLGRIEEAKEQVKLMLGKNDSKFTQAEWRQGYFYSDPSIVEAEVTALAKAGL